MIRFSDFVIGFHENDFEVLLISQIKNGIICENWHLRLFRSFRILSLSNKKNGRLK